MATGTGKTFTLVNQIYRLMKSGIARRVLFLVDRRALAAQAVRAFSAFEAEPGQKFDQIYEVYSSRFQAEDFGEEDKFDPKVLPQKYLTDPQPGHAFVVCGDHSADGRQRPGQTGRLWPGRRAHRRRRGTARHSHPRLRCHRRGRVSSRVYVAGNLDLAFYADHFDAIKIGLTATPASHDSVLYPEGLRVPLRASRQRRLPRGL